MDCARTGPVREYPLKYFSFGRDFDESNRHFHESIEPVRKQLQHLAGKAHGKIVFYICTETQNIVLVLKMQEEGFVTAPKGLVRDMRWLIHNRYKKLRPPVMMGSTEFDRRQYEKQKTLQKIQRRGRGNLGPGQRKQFSVRDLKWPPSQAKRKVASSTATPPHRRQHRR